MVEAGFTCYGIHRLQPGPDVWTPDEVLQDMHISGMTPESLDPYMECIKVYRRDKIKAEHYVTAGNSKRSRPSEGSDSSRNSSVDRAIRETQGERDKNISNCGLGSALAKTSTSSQRLEEPDLPPNSYSVGHPCGLAKIGNSGNCSDTVMNNRHK